MFPMNQQTAAFFQYLPNNYLTAFQSMFPAGTPGADAARTAFGGGEQLASVVRAGADGQVAYLNRVVASTVQGAQRLVELNITAAKTSMEESTVVAKQLLGSKDPQEFIGFLVALAQPTVTKSVAYTRHVATIATETQAEVTRATEEQFAEAGRQYLGLLALKNTPASENTLAMAKTAISNASTGLEQFNQKSKQAVDTVEAAVNNVMNQAVQAAEQASTAATRARSKQ